MTKLNLHNLIDCSFVEIKASVDLHVMLLAPRLHFINESGALCIQIVGGSEIVPYWLDIAAVLDTSKALEFCKLKLLYDLGSSDKHGQACPMSL